MSYITTVTGIHFYPLNPNPKDIDIEDIHNRLSPDRGDSFAAAARRYPNPAFIFGKHLKSRESRNTKAI